MEPERWRQIERLYHAALELEGSSRAAFLEEACGGDQELWQEVESLLAQQEKSDGFLEAPALVAAAKIVAQEQTPDSGNERDALVGAVISHYHVEGKLGAGGMGVVYRAHDTKLNRDVALKVLPESVAHDADRMARFEREAQVLASLNHPNIAAIYGLEESGGISALVMELVEGPTLAERLVVAQGPQPGPAASRKSHRRAGAHTSPLQLEEALPIAKQVAEALEYAHEHGVIHRDLKPANIKITPEGTVKVLDFGLAKLTQPLTAPSPQGRGWPAGPGEGIIDTPTASLDPESLTTPGMIVGTAAYMSPEQARGQAVDRRADIWAFGCVLYEMLAGSPAFAGETFSDTLAAVLTKDPDWSALPAATPAPVQRLVHRCLSKDPKQRLQAIGDARITIEETLSGVPQDSSAPPLVAAAVPARARRRALPWVIVLALGAVAISAFFIARRFRAHAPPPVFEQLTFQRGSISAARFAPHGETFVYAAAWDGHPVELYTARFGSPGWRSLDLPGANLLSISSSGEMAVLLRSQLQPFFDFYRGTLAEAPLAGGAPREILNNVEWADWSPDGSELAVVRYVDGERQLEYPIGKVLYRTSGWISHIRISPQGDKIAFLDHPLWSDNEGSVAVVDLQGKKRTLSKDWESEEGLAWSPSGKQVWFTAAKAGANKQMYAVSLQGKLRPVAGVPGGMTLEDVLPNGQVLLTRDSTRYVLAGLAPGATKERNLSWLDLSYACGLSADGKELLFTEMSAGTGPFYAACLRRTDGSSPPVRLGEGVAQSLSPDGQWALSIILSSPEQLLMLPTGTGSERALPRGPIDHYAQTGARWFPDGKRILVVGRAQGHGFRCYVQDSSGGEPKPITPEGFVGWLPSVSGKEILASNPQGKFWLYPVAGGNPEPVPGLGPGDVPIQWSADGRALFVEQPGALNAVLYRFDLATGKRLLWKKLAPANRTGLAAVGPVVITQNGRAYAYNYLTVLSNLYLAQGLK